MNDLPAPSADLAPHPARGSVLGEVHARPFHPMTAPRRLVHFAFMTSPQQSLAARQALDEFCAARGVAPPPPNARHVRLDFGSMALRWESHAEFITYTWELAAPSGRPFEPRSDTLAGVMRALPQPGPHLVSVDLHLIESDAGIDLESLFDPSSLAAAYAGASGEGALVATDFRPDHAGFVRILVCNRALTPLRTGALVQRLLEIETYRLLALLGLPEAQALGPRVGAMEARVAALTQEMVHIEGLAGNRRLLDELTQLLAELEAMTAASSFRFGASAAYEELVEQRLNSIAEKPYEPWSSLSAFLARRVRPALRTVHTLARRQAQLAEKLQRAAQLLRTRVDVEIERQNRDLLHSMNERTRMQLRLQQTVEGLSVAAISYYVIGLLGHVFEGLEQSGIWHVAPVVAEAVAVPLVIIVMALIVRRIRNRHGDGD